MSEKVIIVGAAGRDFHNFNVFFRNNADYEVVAFTAAQIPDIHGRKYPAELAGPRYPEGINIYDEGELPRLIHEYNVEVVVFAYSDVPTEKVVHVSAIANANGANFMLLDAQRTMLRSEKPVISICAVRTGCGKSQTTRQVCRILKAAGKKVVAVRHPMPYGDLAKQAVQRFATYEDFDTHKCTIEEREEYEALVDMGVIVYAGVDYERILRQAEQEADVVIWDGGNNDTPFFKPDVNIVLFDPHRAGHELAYYPGTTNLLLADVAIINKTDSCTPEQAEQVKQNIEKHNPNAKVILAESEILVDEPEKIKGSKVLVVEDGPTLTHGEMTFGAGSIAAQRCGAAEIVDPRPYAVDSIKATYEKYPHVTNVLPAMGYGDKQVKDLQETINRVDCDYVVFGTPFDLPRLMNVEKPTLRVRYEYKDREGQTKLEDVILDGLNLR